MQNKHELWKFLVVSAPCKYGRKDGRIFGKAGSKDRNKDGKNLAPITSSPVPSPSMTPINLANQFCRSSGGSNKMIINVEMACTSNYRFRLNIWLPEMRPDLQCRLHSHSH